MRTQGPFPALAAPPPPLDPVAALEGAHFPQELKHLLVWETLDLAMP